MWGGGRIDEELGGGYSLHATGRIGIAEWQPAIELFASHSDRRRTLSVGAYNRLAPAGDWGNPLSLGSAISALLVGRDEGFYYRASGLELTSVPDGAAGGGFLWSLFAEQERAAVQKTTFSFARVTRGSSFEPNLTADKGVYVGARARHLASMGLDPEGFRLLSDVRLEAARGDTGSYARAAADLTASHGIGDGAAALTLAAGSSAGALPAQRFWFLGGTQTVRGQRPRKETGNAFWLPRAEMAHGSALLRPVLFSDFGWAGDRTAWRGLVFPISGVGAGFSIMDGLVRFDVARGINPERMWRIDTYLEARL